MPTLSNAPITPQKMPPQPKEQKEYVYVRDHVRTLRQIAADKPEVESSDESETVDTPVKSPTSQEVVPSEERQEKPTIDPEKLAQEVADRAAEATSKSFREEMTKIAESNKTAATKKQEELELTAVWDKEGRLPQDYKEIFNEAERISQIRATKAFESHMAERDKVEADKRAATAQAQATHQEQQDQRQKDMETRIGAELDELRAGKFLPTIVKADDVNDPGFKAQSDLVEFGIKLNKERITQGKPPIDSVAKLYFMYYKPTKGTKSTVAQPAGRDAPVAGASTSPVTSEPSDKPYIYARDHKKSYRQLLYEKLHRN